MRKRGRHFFAIFWSLGDRVGYNVVLKSSLNLEMTVTMKYPHMIVTLMVMMRVDYDDSEDASKSTNLEMTVTMR